MNDNIETQLTELGDPKAFAAVGALVGLMLGVIGVIIAGSCRFMMLTMIMAPIFGGILAWAAMHGYRTYPNSVKPMGIGAVAGLLIGLLPGFWWILLGMSVTLVPLGLYRGYAEVQAVKYAEDERRERALPISAGVLTLSVCASVAGWLNVGESSYDLLWTLLLMPLGFVVYITATSIFEMRITKEEFTRFEKKLAKRKLGDRLPPMPSL